jgi:hypothetical protein
MILITILDLEKSSRDLIEYFFKKIYAKIIYVIFFRRQSNILLLIMLLDFSYKYTIMPHIL